MMKLSNFVLTIACSNSLLKQVFAFSADPRCPGANRSENRGGQSRNPSSLYEKVFLLSAIRGITLEGTSSELCAVWSELKAQINSFFSKLRRPQKVENLPAGAKAEENGFHSARMTHNRMQALDGAGYRQCYMDKLREVASESEKPEANREYWFGKEELQVPESKAGAEKATTSQTKLPKIRDVIPSQSRITYNRLQAYVETLPKPEDD
jgi:hypothetical protein